MEPQFKSSFIPKKDIVINSRGSSAQVSMISQRGLIDTIAIVVFVLTLLAWGGLFGYQKYVEASIVEIEREIVAARGNIDSVKVEQFLAFGKQINIAKQKLNSHIIVEPVFSLLSQYTIPSVQFTNFTFSIVPTGLLVETKARTRTFSAVALQEQVLMNVADVEQLVVNDIDVDDAQVGITFKLQFIVPRKTVLYSEFVKDMLQPSPPPTAGSLPASPVLGNTQGDRPVTETDMDDVNNFFNELFQDLE